MCWLSNLWVLEVVGIHNVCTRNCGYLEFVVTQKKELVCKSVDMQNSWRLKYGLCVFKFVGTQKWALKMCGY